MIGLIGRKNYTKDEADEISTPKEGKTPILIGRSPVFKLYEIIFREGEISGTITMIPQEQTTKGGKKS